MGQNLKYKQTHSTESKCQIKWFVEKNNKLENNLRKQPEKVVLQNIPETISAGFKSKRASTSGACSTWKCPNGAKRRLSWKDYVWEEHTPKQKSWNELLHFLDKHNHAFEYEDKENILK